ncbi:BlaI/MecI/CopY family transcriptional regulator [Rapidithrix thailandica]|uniref:BlaI/MecI/CopY family transcriptional regulator n=1 Tax=Rapidithrix thailandica TaxID=413964 RepID=A0AAW9SDH7_9BACT
MKELTKAEEEVMQAIWEIERGFAKEIYEKVSGSPAYSTVLTILRILVKKEFVGYETFGKTHRYFPLISKDAYRKDFMSSFLSRYFNGSFEKMFSFFAQEGDVNLKQVEQLLHHAKQTRKTDKSHE